MTETRAWVRHVKRGTEYEVLGQAQMQTEAPVSDDAMVMVYRGRDGALWVRPTDEFRDGRFAPSPPPAAPCADEVEWCDALTQRYQANGLRGGMPIEEAMWVAEITLAALSPLRQAERERAWREGAEAMRKVAARCAEWAHMVPPDGGSPTEDEHAVATTAAQRIRALPLPPMGGV